MVDLPIHPMNKNTWGDQQTAADFFSWFGQHYDFKNILELGTGWGVSAEWFLTTFKQAVVYSYDERRWQDQRDKIYIDQKLKNRYQDRFHFHLSDFRESIILPHDFDLTFIDLFDVHLKEAIEIALTMNSKMVMIDNIEAKGAEDLIKKYFPELVFIKQMTYNAYTDAGSYKQRIANLYHVQRDNIQIP